ncbi:CACNA1H [Symbiodinium sp. CCMP2592]|nr:CACNA1H [Symbiodinium sp. CCMP2592]
MMMRTETTTYRNCLQNMVLSSTFDMVMAAAILTNTVFIGVEVQWSISNPGMQHLTFQVIRDVYTLIFTVELFLRLAATGCDFFCSGDWRWNLLDLVIVLSSWWETFIELSIYMQGPGSGGGLDPVSGMTGLRTLRIVRITRLVKIARITRVLRVIMALRTLTQSIIYTLKSLIWAMILLVLIVYVFGILFAQAVNDHLMDTDVRPLTDEEVAAARRYFDDLPQTMLSLFMSIAGGVSWEEVVLPLRAISVVWVVIFLTYVSFTYFAVLNVVTGVFCQSAIDSAQSDHDMVLQSILANKQAHIEKIRYLFSEIDQEDSGVITFQMVLRNRLPATLAYEALLRGLQTPPGKAVQNASADVAPQFCRKPLYVYTNDCGAGVQQTGGTPLAKYLTGEGKKTLPHLVRRDAQPGTNPAVDMRNMPTPKQGHARILRWLWKPLAIQALLDGSRLGPTLEGRSSVANPGIATEAQVAEETRWQRAATYRAGSEFRAGLPAPPPLPVAATKEASREPVTTAPTDGGAERQILQQLLQALGNHQEALPESVRTIMAQQGRMETQDHAKTLHRTVSAQATARRELQRIRQARTSFLASWHKYIADLTTLVTQQVDAQGQTLADLDEQEEQWSGKLGEATANLAKLAADGIKQEAKGSMEVEDLDPDEVGEQRVMDAIATQQELEQQRKTHQQAAIDLVEALKQAKDKAAQEIELSQGNREHSRTPRRGGQNTVDVSSSESVKDGNTSEHSKQSSFSLPLRRSPAWTTFHADSRCSLHSVLEDPTFVSPARAQTQALLLQYEVLHDWTLMPATLWDPRSEAHTEEHFGAAGAPLLRICDPLHGAGECNAGLLCELSTFRDWSPPMALEEIGPDEVDGSLRACIREPSSQHLRPATEPPCHVQPFSIKGVQFATCQQVWHFRGQDRLNPQTRTAPPPHLLRSALRRPTESTPSPLSSVVGTTSHTEVRPRKQMSVQPAACTTTLCAQTPAPGPPSSRCKGGSMSSLDGLLPLPDTEVPANAGDTQPGISERWPLVRPPGLLGQLRPPRPSAIAHMRIQAMDVQPIDLLRYPLSELPLWNLKILTDSTQPEGGICKYTCMERLHHVTTRRGADDWSLADFVADAVRTARVLLPPMANLPEPQIVVTARAVPIGHLVVPVDLRRLGGKICCMAVRPGMEATELISEVIQFCGRPPDQALQADQAQALFLQDPLGRVWDRMPADLETVGWLQLQVDHTRLFADPLLRGVPPDNPFAAQDTTSTTTEMLPLVSQGSQVIFVLTGCGATVRSQPQSIATVNVQQNVQELVQAHALQGTIPPGARLQLVSACPMSRIAGVTIVPLLCFPDDGDVHIVYDASTCGSLLHAMTVNPGTMPRDVLMPAQHDRGMIVTVNGVPMAAQHRPLATGDLVQLIANPDIFTAVPAMHVTREIHRLRFLAHPMRLPRLTRPTTAHYPEWQAQAAGAMARFFDARFAEHRLLFGVPDGDTTPVYVIGAQHPPLLVYIGQPLTPEPEEALWHLHQLGLLPRGTRLADPRTMASMVPVFVTIPAGALFATMIMPAPGHPLDFLTFAMPRGRELGGLTLPATRGWRVVPPPHAADGAVATRVRDGDPTDPHPNLMRRVRTHLDPPPRATPVLGPGRPRPLAVREARAMLAPLLAALDQASPQKSQTLTMAEAPPQPKAPANPCTQAAEVDHAGAVQDSKPTGRVRQQVADLEATIAAVKMPVATPFGRRVIPAANGRTADPGCNSLHQQGPAGRILQPASFSTTTPSAAVPPVGTGSMPPAVLALDSLVQPPKPCIGWAIDHEIAAQCLSSHDLAGLYTDLSPLEADLRAPTAAWCTLPLWDPQARCDEVFIFTDGSYYGPHASASWAIVVVVRQGARVCRAGFHAATAHLATVGKESAFQGELEGLIHAAAFACTTGARIVHIASDCQSALDLISSAGGDSPSHPAPRALLGLLNFAHCSGIQVILHKVEAHSGCGLNDLADVLAKQAGRSGCADPWPWNISAFTAAVREYVPERLWLLCATMAACTGLPPLQDNGTWADTCQRIGERPPPLLPVGFLGDPQPPKQCRLPLQILTYNVLSLKGVAAHELMAKGLRAHSVSFAGFQETREQRSGFSNSQGWWVLSASCDEAGAGGTQVWINPNQPGLTWDRQAISILSARPRCLVVLTRVNGLDLAIVVAHAPTAVSSPEQIDEWWEYLHSQVRRIPPRFVLITCIDANARFVQDPAHPDTLEATAQTRNSEHLRDFAHATGAGISQQFSHTGVPLTSWRSPSGHSALLDYILFPRAWRPAAVTLDTPCLNDLHCDVDHFPVHLSLNVTCDTSVRPDVPRVSAEALRTPHGQACVKAAFASLPAIPWSTDTTSHLDLIHRHLHACLKTLPPAPPKPRNPALTESTIALVVQKRHARRCLRTVKLRTARLQAAVSNRPATECESRQLETQLRLEKWHATKCREIRDELTKAILQDRACFARKAIADARDQGPREFSHKLRAVLRTGRKFRSPPLLPVLCTADGERAGREDVMDEFARFFAEPERARPVPIKSLLAQASEPDIAHEPLDGEQLPSVIQLAAAFGHLKPHKAPGISKLPSEVFRVDPMASARAVWPVLAKTAVRDKFPFQWRGGAAAAVPKPGKDGTTLGGFRSVLLLEPTAKAAQVALRPMIHRTFVGIKTATHYGGVAGAPISLPALCARAHLQHLQHTKGCGGAIFVDCRAAYYSIAREVLHASPQELQSDAWVRDRAKIFFTDQGQQDAFIAALRDHAVPDLLRQQPVLATLLRKQLDGTWFSGRIDSPDVMQAESGTVPGSPIADLLFGLAFQHFLHSIEDTLAEQGCQAFATFSCGQPADAEDSSAPTWADDVCILFQTSRPEDVSPAVATIMAGVTHGMNIQGLEANLGEGKTEAMVVVHGQGSQQVRRDLLCTPQPTICFPGPQGEQCVRLVPEYIHLGCVLRADGSDLPGLFHRERQAMLLYRPIRRRLLSNPFLTEVEKCGLLKSRILPCFLHGAGLLVLATSRERAKFEDTIYRLYRGAFRPILGVSCTGFTNLEVVSALGMPTPEELLLTHRARTLAEAARAGLWQVLRCLRSTGSWWERAVEAALTLGLLNRKPEDVDDLRKVLRTDRGLVSRLCRTFLHKRRKGRSFDRNLLAAREAPDAATVLAAVGPGLPWACPQCSNSYASYRQLTVHLARRHKCRTLAVQSAFGTSCQRCSREFWTLRRLTEHLSRSKPCLAAYHESDICPEAPAPTSGSYAWRPATAVAGPQPFWATLNPDIGETGTGVVS